MHDALRVRGGERVGDLGAETQRALEREGAVALDHAFERRAIEPFHDQERPAIVLGDVVNRADIRVIQRRREARLASSRSIAAG